MVGKGLSLLCVVVVVLVVSACVPGLKAELPHRITIDGNFNDWASVLSHYDPDDNINGTVLQDDIPDCHDTNHKGKCDIPEHVYNPIVNILEFKFTHDESHLYAYMRAKGNISLTASGAKAGRSYIQITLDVDNNQTTGYCLCAGGYYPTVCGADMHFELEMYNGTFNTAHYLLHSAWNNETYQKAYNDQKQGIVVPDGPSTYKPYTEWVYYEKDHPMPPDERARCPDGPHTLPNGAEICFVEDKTTGPFKGSMNYAFSEDDREVEISAPFAGFMNYPDGSPVIGIGRMVHFTMALETSGEFQAEDKWSTDGTWQIRGYILEPWPVSNDDDDSNGVSDGIAVLIAFLCFGAGVFFTSVIAAVIIYVLYRKTNGYSSM